MTRSVNRSGEMMATFAQMSYNNRQLNANRRMVFVPPTPVLNISKGNLQMSTSNDTPRTIEIPLSQGFYATIFEQDADLSMSHKWHVLNDDDRHYVNTNVYVDGKWSGKRLHTFIMERMINRPLAKGEMVDHIDTNTLNNKRDNLRLCSNGQNLKNKRRYKTNKLGLKGVYKRDGKYRAQIQVDGKKIMLGTYDTSAEAYQVYCEAAKKYHGEFARFE